MNLIVNKDLSSCILCSVSNPAMLKCRRTAFSPNIANYASRRTALFIVTFGNCDVMPCYQHDNREFYEKVK